MTLTEVDEVTYRSSEHMKDAPRFNVNNKEVQLEAVGIISDLLALEHGITSAEMDAKLAECVRFFPTKPPEGESVRAEATRMRAEAGVSIYGPVENYLFPQSQTEQAASGIVEKLPKFLFPVGTSGHVTTRLSTFARYGCRYQVFGYTHTTAEVTEKCVPASQPVCPC
jgi:hypothetical protein